MCEAIRLWLCICIYSFAVRVCGFGCMCSFLKASWQLLIFPKKWINRDDGAFSLDTPLFSLPVSNWMEAKRVLSWRARRSKSVRQSNAAEHPNNVAGLQFAFIYMKSQGYLICRQTCASTWMKPKQKEGGFIRRRVTDVDCVGEGVEKTDESRAIGSEYRCLTHSAQRCHGLWMHSEWSREVSKVGRTASLAKGRHSRYAHIYVETQGAIGVHNSATTGSITDWLLEGSDCTERPGTEVDQCRLQRSPTYQTCIVHMLGAGAATHGPTPTPLLFFIFLTSPIQRW